MLYWDELGISDRWLRNDEGEWVDRISLVDDGRWIVFNGSHNELKDRMEDAMRVVEDLHFTALEVMGRICT